MAYPWMAQAAQNKLALREGLKIIFKLAIREPPPPSYALKQDALRDEDPVGALPTYGRNSGRRRVPPPTAPNPRHPVRSISFLKHNILPIILGEQNVQRFREKRLVAQTPAEVARASGARNGKNAQQQQQQHEVAQKPPIETVVYLWKATRPPLPTETVAAPEPTLSPQAAKRALPYDCSHMKASKRKARRYREELRAQRTERHKIRQAGRLEARRKIEREQRTEKLAAGRALHEAAERAGLEAKEQRRKEWAKKNPALAKAARQRAEELAIKLQKIAPAPPKAGAPLKQLRA